MKIGGELIGLADLDKALAELPKATAKNVLRRALIKAAKPTEDLAVMLAPKDRGDLSESITVSTKIKASQDDGGTPNGVDVYIGATTPKGAHAHLVEYGTAHMAAHPFLRPAWMATREAVLRAIKGEVWSALAKSARTLARKAERGKLSRSAREALTR